LHQRAELVQCVTNVTDQRRARWRAGGLIRIISDVEQGRALRQVVTGDIRVITEDRRAGDQNNVVSPQLLGQRRDGEWQKALEKRVVLGK
jgi:hypothetical protein